MLARFFSLFSGDPGISQTVEKVRQVIHYALRDPHQRIRERAESLVRPLREGWKADEIESVFNWARDHFRYTNDPQGLEFIKSPEVSDAEISVNGVFLGDCDDIAAYLAALLRSIGYHVRLVVINPKDSPRQDFQHIFVRVFDRQRQKWIALDGTAKHHPLGWEAPAKRRREYDV